MASHPVALIYLDTSALGRLSDANPALAAEAEAMARIAQACSTGRLRLLTSEVLAIEVANGPDYARDVSEGLLRVAAASVSLAASLAVADRLSRLHLPLLDTLHVAAAATGGAWHAVSCDQRDWLRHAVRIAAVIGSRPALVSP